MRGVVALLLAVVAEGVFRDNVKPDGCKDGFWGVNCKSVCSAERCVQYPHRSFPDDVGIVCDKETGVAIECDACQSGYFGRACDKQCVSEFCDVEKTITCDKNDGSNLFCENCIGGHAGQDCTLSIFCSPVQAPQYGKTNCSATDMVAYGSACNFSCDGGFTMKGPSVAKCLGNPPLVRVGFVGMPKVDDVVFLAGGAKGWNDTEELCLYLGYGSASGAVKIGSQLLSVAIDSNGKPVRFDSPIIAKYFHHIECSGLTDVKCMTPDLSGACVDESTCESARAMVESCAECYQQERSTYLRGTNGKFVRVSGKRKGNCTTANGDSAPSWYSCNKMFHKWCRIFPGSQYCEKGSNGRFYAPNPCYLEDCNLRGTCNQFTGKCDCQWAYYGDHCENTILTTTGHWNVEPPTCEANPCSFKSLSHQDGTCTGLMGDICVPQPKPGYTCRGQLSCDEDGGFHGDAACLPKERCNSTGDCHPNAACVHGFCECSPNYWGDGVDSCTEWDVCGPGQTEIVLPSSTNNRVCGYVNECERNNGGCEHKCFSEKGTHSCGCQEGYILADDNKSCKKKTCQPLKIQNAAVACTGSFQDQCAPDCLPGFESVGTFVCEASGIFVGNGRCRGLPCTRLVIENGDTDNPCQGVSGDACMPICKPGYTSQGYLTCISPNFVGNAKCLPNECEPLVVQNALERCEGLTGEVCDNLKCQEGFVFRGSAVCMPNRKWRGLAACDNVNECAMNDGRGVCQHKCTDQYGGFKCSCEAGYSLGADGRSCIPNKCNSLQKSLWSKACEGELRDICTPVGIPGYSCYGSLVCRRQVGSDFPLWDGYSSCSAVACAKKYIHGAKAPCIGVTGDTCTVVPLPGYTCEGMDVCNGETGHFEGTAQCRGVKCGTKAIPNGDVCIESETGSFCNNFNCFPGFVPTGSFQCIWDSFSSSATWIGDGQCKPETKCSLDPDVPQACGENAACKPVDALSGVCECREGFWGDGFSCQTHSECPPGKSILAGSRSRTRDTICTETDACPEVTTCDKQYGYCMSTVGGYVCGCNPGYVKAKDGSNKCSPTDCQSLVIRGAGECIGSVGSVCNLADHAQPGYHCEGSFVCDPLTLNFRGNGSCQRQTCETYQPVHSMKPCNGRHGDKCALLCEHGYKQTGVPVCNGTQFTQETCEAKSFKTCGHFGIEAVNASCGDAAGIMGCPKNVTFAQAQEFCRGEGGRLCRLEEVSAGFVDSKSGACAINRDRIWTLSPCNGGYFSRSAGTDLGDFEYARTKCSSPDEFAAVKCCADVESAPIINACSPMYGNGGCADKCYYDASKLSGYYCACERPHTVLSEDRKSCILRCPLGTTEQAGACVPRKEFAFRHVSFGGKYTLPLQVGKTKWELAELSECKFIAFPYPYNVNDTVQVQTTASFDTTDARQRPFVMWVETIDTTGFRVCIGNVGFHTYNETAFRDVFVNWVAYVNAPFPAVAREVSITPFSRKYTHWEDVDAIPHIPKPIGDIDEYDEITYSKFHAFITPNHRNGGVSDASGRQGDSRKHNPLAVWIERSDERGVSVGLEEPVDRNWMHCLHTNIDVLMFKDWSGMQREGIHTGSTSMSTAKAGRGAASVGDNGLGAQIISTPAREGLCLDVPYHLPTGLVLRKPPIILISPNHRGDPRVAYEHQDYAANHNAIVAWVETMGTSGMRICYRDFARYSRKHGKSISVDWMIFANVV